MRLSALVLAASFALGCGHGAVTWTPSLEAQSKQIQPTPQDEGRALRLDGVKNGRDLGGLAGMHSVVPPGRFFRSASTSHATERDKQALLARGIVADVDLRTYWEALASPDALAHDPRFHYQRVSLFGFGMLDWLTFSPGDRGTSYMDALANHQSDFRKVFHALASQARGAVLYHCASGKDRTGLVTAILLSLAGVERSVIVHDYAISAHYLFPDAETHDELAHAIAASPPPAIESFLEALDDQYGGARSYLRTIGVSEEDIDTLSERLGQ